MADKVIVLNAEQIWDNEMAVVSNQRRNGELGTSLQPMVMIQVSTLQLGPTKIEIWNPNWYPEEIGYEIQSVSRLKKIPFISKILKGF